MKKNAVHILKRAFLILFILGTMISLLLTYKHTGSGLAFGFLFFTYFLILYVLLMTLINLRKLTWVEIRKRLIKFIAFFILFTASNFCFDYIFRPSDISFFRAFSNSLAFSFGISFLDVTFLKNKES